MIASCEFGPPRDGLDVLIILNGYPDLARDYKRSYVAHGLDKLYGSFEDILNSADTAMKVEVLGKLNKVKIEDNKKWQSGHERKGLPPAHGSGGNDESALVSYFKSEGRQYTEGFTESFSFFGSLFASAGLHSLSSEYIAAMKALGEMAEEPTNL